MIRLTVPSLEEDDLKAVYEVIASGFLVQGAHVGAFEKSVAKYVGAQHAIAVSNCTAALHLALLALDTRPGDMVIVPSNTPHQVIPTGGAPIVLMTLHVPFPPTNWPPAN